MQLRELKLNFNTSNVEDMEAMFCRCGIPTLNLSSFTADKLVYADYMFFSSTIQHLNLSNFNIDRVKKVEGMFEGCEIAKLTATSDRLKSLFDKK